MIRRCPALLAGLIVLLAFAAPALAQGGRSEINGTVVDAGKAVLPGVTVTATNQDTGLERAAVSSSEGKFTIPTLLPGTYTIKAELQGFQVTNLTGLVVNVGQELTVNLTLQVAGVAETLDGHRTVAARRSDVEPHRHQRDQLRDRRSAEREPQPVQPDADDPRARAGAAGRIVRRRPVQRQRPGDDQQPVPRRRAERQRLAPRRLAGHAGARVARLDGRVSGADAPVRRRVRRLDRRRREQRDQERHQQAVGPRVRVLPEQQAAGDQLLPETGRRGESGVGQQRVRRQHRRPDRQEQAVLLRQLRGHARQRRRRTSTSRPSAAPLAVSYSTTTAFHGPNTFARFDYHAEREQPGQLPLDARGRHHRARFDRGRPGRCSTPPGTRTIRATRCSAGRGRRC